jgi:epoxyqueuosine reductase
MDIKTVEKKVNEFLENATDEIWFGRNKEKLFEHISAGQQSSSRRIFRRIAEANGSHLLPADFIDKKSGSNLSVISFVFHFNKNIVESNSGENFNPSFAWYEIRFKFELILAPFISYLRELFQPYTMVVPYKDARYSVFMKNNTLASNWSERHAAFACGLGSFGLHSALITDRGCAHRLISVIVEKECPETDIIEDDLHYNCLYYKNNECGKCAVKCPVGAIKDGVHDLEKCYNHEMITNRLKAVEIFGSEIAACGLCMCGVPCDIMKPE